jgi:Na+/pantothenate symporter
MEQTVIWSFVSFIISFCIVVCILYLIKPKFIIIVNSDKQKKVQTTKLFLISIIISICLALIVFTLLLNYNLPDIAVFGKVGTEKVYVSDSKKIEKVYVPNSKTEWIM